MKNLGWNVTAFLIMYLIATIVGFATYFLFGLTAMWLAVFILMPGVCVYLIYWYLVKIKSTVENVWRDVLILIVVWIALSFLFDALTYIIIVPKIFNIPPNWKFFVQQSPWIWICYLVLFIPGYFAKWFYIRKISKEA